MSRPHFIDRRAEPAGHDRADTRQESQGTRGFWPDDLSFHEADPGELTIVNHREVTDAYLISLAKSHEGISTGATIDFLLSHTGMPQRPRGSSKGFALSWAPHPASDQRGQAPLLSARGSRTEEGRVPAPALVDYAQCNI